MKISYLLIAVFTLASAARADRLSDHHIGRPITGGLTSSGGGVCKKTAEKYAETHSTGGDEGSKATVLSSKLIDKSYSGSQPFGQSFTETYKIKVEDQSGEQTMKITIHGSTGAQLNCEASEPELD
jgi:hypothetical protein